MINDVYLSKEFDGKTFMKKLNRGLMERIHKKKYN